MNVMDLPGMWETADFEGGIDEIRGPSFPVVHTDIAIYEMEYMVMCLKYEWLFNHDVPVNWAAFNNFIV